MVCGIGAVAAVIASTMTAGWPLEPLSAVPGPLAPAGCDLPDAAPATKRCWPNQYPPPAATAIPSTTTTARIDLFIFAGRWPISGHGRQKGRLCAAPEWHGKRAD